MYTYLTLENLKINPKQPWAPQLSLWYHTTVRKLGCLKEFVGLEPMLLKKGEHSLTTLRIEESYFTLARKT